MEEEPYDVEKKRNERNIKLSVFKEVLAQAHGKHSEVRKMLSEFEQRSKQKDNIVQSDIESQMNSIQKRIQIKSKTIFLNVLISRLQIHKQISLIYIALPPTGET